MLKLKEFIQRAKAFINENPRRKKFLLIIFIAAIIPLTVLAALTIQDLRQRAGGTGVFMVDANGNFLSTTSDTSVYLRINLPVNWVTGGVGMNKNNLIKQAYAQVSCGDEICSPGQTCQTINEGDGIVSKICVGTSIPTSTPTKTPASTNAISPTSIPNCGDVNCGAGEICTTVNEGDGTVSKICVNASVPTSIPTSILTITPTSSPSAVSPTSGPSPTPIPNILQGIYIENKDSDGSSNGSEPLRITSGFESYLNSQIPWKLNDLLPFQNQATRLVQVTFLGSRDIVYLTTTVTLVRATNPTEILSRVEVSMDCKNGLPQIAIKESCYLSALAFDTANFPISRSVNYEWGISSTNSIGTLVSTQNNITTFYAQNVGSGVIWVIARQGNKQAEKSVSIQVRNPDAIFLDNKINSTNSPTPAPQQIINTTVDLKKDIIDQFGAKGPNLKGDINHDGVINEFDYNSFLRGGQ